MPICWRRWVKSRQGRLSSPCRPRPRSRPPMALPAKPAARLPELSSGGMARGTGSRRSTAAATGRQHDLYLRHDRAAQGRAPGAGDGRPDYGGRYRPAAGLQLPAGHAHGHLLPALSQRPNLYTAAASPFADLIVLQPRFDPEALLQVIAAERISHLFLTPTNFVRLLKLPEARRRRYDVSSLEAVIHAGAPCPPAVKRAMIEWFGPVDQRVLWQHGIRPGHLLQQRGMAGSARHGGWAGAGRYDQRLSR